MVETKASDVDVGAVERRVRRGWAASMLQLGPFAFAALAIAMTIILALGWRVDQEAVAVRVDMLGRERALTVWVLAGTERAVAEGGAGSEETMAHLDLLTDSWATVRDDGPELGLDFQPTGRTVASMPDLDSRTMKRALPGSRRGARVSDPWRSTPQVASSRRRAIP